MGAEVRLGWDNSDLFKGAKQAETRLGKFDGAVTKAGAAGSKALGFLSRNVVAFGGGLSVATLAADAFGRAVSFQALEKGFEAIVGSGEEAELQMQRLRDLAKAPGLGFRMAITLSRDLQATGFQATEAERMIREVGNAVSLMGGGQDDVFQVVDAMKDLVSEGALVDDKVDRIAERLPMFRRLMLEAFGSSSTTAVREMGVSVEDFLGIMVDKLQNEVPRAAETTKTAIENLKDSWDQMLVGIGAEMNSDEGTLGKSIAGLRSLIDGLTMTDAVGSNGDAGSQAAQLRAINQQKEDAAAAFEKGMQDAANGKKLNPNELPSAIARREREALNFDTTGEVDPVRKGGVAPSGLEFMLQYAAAEALAAAEAVNLAEAEARGEDRKAALREKADLTRDVVAALKEEMAVLALRADGKDEQADALAKEVSMREEAARLAERTNLTETEALALVKERESLATKAAARAGKRRIRIKGDDEPRLTRKSFQGIDGTKFNLLDGVKARAAAGTEMKPQVAKKDEAASLLDSIRESNERTATGIEELVRG